jgi:two-component sensor histidine kinase
MFDWINKILNFGTNNPNQPSYGRHTTRLINMICFFVIVAKIASDFFTFQLGDLNIMLHTIISIAGFCWVLYLNYKYQNTLAKTIFMMLIFAILISIPFLIPHSLNADGLFLVAIAIIAALYNNIIVIMLLVFLDLIILFFWHIANSKGLLHPLSTFTSEETLYIELVYSALILVLLLIALFSFKKTASDYQKELSNKLHEKELLFKEVHHRVKNNLQVIVSILSLEEYNEHSAEALEVIKDIKARVVSMAIVHNKLYETEDLKNIDMQEYITALVDLLIEMYDQKTLRINKKIQIEKFNLDLEYSIPLGLILTELVSNSIKHAFDPKRPAIIEIHGEKIASDVYRLKIKDNGPGINEQTETKDSLGFLLISILCKQIKADLKRNNDNGLETTIIFRV